MRGLCHRFITGEGDVELAVIRQAESLANGFRELLVPLRPRPHLQMLPSARLDPHLGKIELELGVLPSSD